jgi:hypothetical protein
LSSTPSTPKPINDNSNANPFDSQTKRIQNDIVASGIQLPQRYSAIWVSVLDTSKFSTTQCIVEKVAKQASGLPRGQVCGTVVIDIPNSDIKEFALMTDECIRMAMGGRQGQSGTGKGIRWCNGTCGGQSAPPKRKTSFLYDYPGVEVVVSVPGLVQFSMTVDSDNKPIVVCQGPNWQQLYTYITLLNSKHPQLAKTIAKWPKLTDQKLEQQSENTPRKEVMVQTRITVKIIITHQELGSRLQVLKLKGVSLHTIFLDACGTFMKIAERQQLNITSANTNIEVIKNAVSLMDNMSTPYGVVAGTFSVRSCEGTTVAVDLILQNMLLLCGQHKISLDVLNMFLFPDSVQFQQTGGTQNVTSFTKECKAHTGTPGSNFVFLLKELEILLHCVLHFRGKGLCFRLLFARRYRNSMFTFTFLVRAHQSMTMSALPNPADYIAEHQHQSRALFDGSLETTAMYTRHISHLDHPFYKNLPLSRKARPVQRLLSQSR